MRNLPLLLRKFPELVPVFPWIPILTSVPTPVQYFPEKGIWVKRDDLVCDQYGGNKARKFEWILGELKSQERRSLLTFGGLCSNHCTAAAIYGRSAGLNVHLCFVQTPLQPREYDELLLQAFLGAKQHLVGPETLRELGRPIVPPAGSSIAGILGYVNAGLELSEQIARGAMPAPDAIYVAAATRGTAHGLAMGLVLSGIVPPPSVIAVETITRSWQMARMFLPSSQRLLDRLRSLSPELHRRLPAHVRQLDCRGCFGFDRDPLGTVNAHVLAAQSDALSIGLDLDVHYSARAWAAMMATRQEWDGKTVMFWQTHGQPSSDMLLSARESCVKLPASLDAVALQALRIGKET